MNLGNWQLETIDGGAFSVDGGVVYGVVPKTLWRKAASPDGQNRVRLRNNCVLARDGRQTLLIDAGYGGKHSLLDQRFYQFDTGEPLLRSLASFDVAPEDVDMVVLSHLHFDHAGGGTRYDARRRLSPTFPRAQYVIGRLEWEDATSRRPELESAYSVENLAPLSDSGAVVLVESNAQVAPGLRTHLTGGHTRGHLSLIFESAGQTALYLGDICPTTAHLRRMWNMAYDTQPLETRRNKPRLLGEAADRQWWVLWSHDLTIAAGRLTRRSKRDFEVVDPRARL